MQLKFYGTRGTFPTSEQMVSTLISHQGQSLLIDVGSTGIFGDQDALYALEHILLTHHHNDHVALLPNLVLARLYLAKSKGEEPRKCSIVSPEPVSQIMATMDLGEEDLYDHTTEVPQQLIGLQVRSYITSHPELNYCYEFKSERCTLVYTGDTTYDSGLAEFCRGADVLVCEASYSDQSSERAQRWGHMTPSLVAKLLDQAHPALAILNHFVELEGVQFAEAVRAHSKQEIDLLPAVEGLEVNLDEGR